ncbi:MAG: hypothetical protein QN152_04820 [Armatimonadota bacterium]|nr:hypothetical protein [Armatimonadota bacterium]MDR7470963.1 hypothetical protein [Armatimonadota bacterium]MDR7538839.1 hypothetical protein [Armatimonadota bacterium]
MMRLLGRWGVRTLLPAVLLPAVTAAVVLPAAAQPALPPFDQSRIYAREADFQRAIQPYQAAVAAEARNARAHFWLGFAYLYVYRQFRAGLAPYAAGYLPRALGSLRQAVQLDEKLLPAVLALHDALVLAGQHGEAEALVRRLLPQQRPPGALYTLPPG